MQLSSKPQPPDQEGMKEWGTARLLSVTADNMAAQLIKLLLVGIIWKANQRGEENPVEYAQVEAVVMDIEKHLNNCPLTYMESETRKEQVLMPSAIVWGQEVYTI